MPIEIGFTLSLTGGYGSNSLTRVVISPAELASGELIDPNADAKKSSPIVRSVR
jgi:hypothetical protein